MALFAQRMGHGLRWLGRNGKYFNRVGWLLIVGTVFVSCSQIGRAENWTFRYLPENFVFAFAVLLVAVGFAGSLLSLGTERWPTAVFGIAIGGLFLALTFPPRSPFDDAALSSVCGRETGCFHLSRGPTITDTVYDLWHTAEPDELIWRRLVGEGALNYSEDGSFTENPRLLLSGNERILVLERGGIYADAIDLHLRRIVSGGVLWGPPDYHERMRANSRRIEAILAENR